MEDAGVRGQHPGMARTVGRVLQSSLGLKFVMALSGAGLVGFVVGHLVGNLLVFKGSNGDAINAYAQGLKDLGAGLWVMRGGVLACAVAHVAAAGLLTRRSRAARPQGYAIDKAIAATYAARTMRVSGVLVLLYVIYHLVHFTFGGADPAAFHQMLPDGRHDVYNMVVVGFQHPLVAGVYLVAQVLLGVHLSHGIQSAFQSLGLVTEPYRRLTQWGGRALAAVLVVGFVAIPLAVQLGVLLPIQR
ncbi:MAG: succinate dehydrogenase cytochrome b subunit [Myxococcales bacterium]|nr:succinate dehydrogenase cytochrome b subunit [Myxococcales bacterium]